jgi:GNAT superfamily N-acetyltransferase
MALTYVTRDKHDPADIKLLSEGLNQHAASLGVPAQMQDLNIFAYNAANEAMAGITAQIGWAFCYVKLLWVHDSLRRQGIGRRLMEMAEAEALKRGCHTMAVDTYNYQGPAFYPKLGFTEFGRVDGLGHDRTLTRHWYMKRIA